MTIPDIPDLDLESALYSLTEAYVEHELRLIYGGFKRIKENIRKGGKL